MKQEVHPMDVFRRLRNACREAGGQAAFAEKVGVTPSFVCAVLNARRQPTDAMLARIGVKRVVHYVEASN